MLFLLIGAACVLSLPWTLSMTSSGAPRYSAGELAAARLPPSWAAPTPDQARRLNAIVPEETLGDIAARHGTTAQEVGKSTEGELARDLREHWPRFVLGTDVLGRSLLARLLLGGAISLAVGLAAAAIAIVIGTLYGSISAYAGGVVDAVMMRIVDVLFGLPYVLIVVLLAVAGGAIVDEYASREGARGRWVQAQAREGKEGLEAAALEAFPPRQLPPGTRMGMDLAVLLAAIGGTSWLTMARVVRGQVLSLKARPFMDAARAAGAGPSRIFLRHLLPNLADTVIVYATLTIPQAMLQEAFLSFLGIGVRPPLPSWGRLAAEGLPELNPYQSNWWLLVFPCLMLTVTLVCLSLMGERLRVRLSGRSVA